MVSYWLAIALLALAWRSADSCMCSERDSHPQTQFCNSDFVIVGRVQKVLMGKGDLTSYKVKIRHYFKATPKAELALKSGRIFTSSSEAMCGKVLQPRETYIIAGRIHHLEAHINICNYIKKLREVTARQRKGFRLLYKQGCTCKVHLYWNSKRRSSSHNTCVAQSDSCETKHGICLHNRKGQCKWTRTPALTRCNQAHKLNATNT